MNKHEIDFYIYKFGTRAGYQCTCGQVVYKVEAAWEHYICEDESPTRNIWEKVTIAHVKRDESLSSND
jgi:hypothetical protein